MDYASLLGKKDKDNLRDEELRILATNVEVLNQALNKAPLTGGGGGLSPQQYHEFMENFRSITKKIDFTDTELRKLLTQQLAYLKSGSDKIYNFAKHFPEEKQELDIVLKRLSKVMEMFEAADKQSIVDLTKEIRTFNQRMGEYTHAISVFQTKLMDTFNQKINDLGDMVANRLARTGLIGIGIFVFVGILFFILLAVK
ncbi:hypothetical protein KY348_00205 [Candidatus Woesearchaeota archaeon]|nr:hypothetical protein [Candidatus Woesearchaeota archaeon]